ncbi:MAG: hypothetical protein R3Y54_05955 [Eubacteriales bacterium]
MKNKLIRSILMVCVIVASIVTTGCNKNSIMEEEQVEVQSKEEEEEEEMQLQEEEEEEEQVEVQSKGEEEEKVLQVLSEFFACLKENDNETSINYVDLTQFDDIHSLVFMPEIGIECIDQFSLDNMEFNILSVSVAEDTASASVKMKFFVSYAFAQDLGGMFWEDGIDIVEWDGDESYIVDYLERYGELYVVEDEEEYLLVKLEGEWKIDTYTMMNARNY